MKITIILKKPTWFFNIIKNFIIVFVVLIVGLFALELLVRKIKPQLTYTDAVKKSSGDFQYSSFAPFTLRPNIKRGLFYTNSLGYRSKEFSKEKPQGIYRILFLGDSFVSSIEEDNEKAPPQVVERILNVNQKKYEVINAGFHDGYSPDSYYAYLKTEGLSLKPDMVIMGVYLQNDVGDIKTNIWDKLDEKGLPIKVVSDWRRIDSQGRQFDGYPNFRYRFSYLKESHLWILIASWLEKNKYDWVYPKKDIARVVELAKWFDLTYSNCIFQPECFPVFSSDFQKTLTVLKGTADLLKEQNVKLAITFFPSKFQLGLLGEPRVGGDEAFILQNTIMNYFRDNNLLADFIDLTTDFSVLNTADYYLTWDTHFNTAGNERAGQIIAQKVKEMVK